MEDLVVTRLKLLRLPKITKQQFSIVCKVEEKREISLKFQIIDSSCLVLEEIDLSAITVNEEHPQILQPLTRCKNLQKLAYVPRALQ
jgi:negative regulator of sigma E activity